MGHAVGELVGHQIEGAAGHVHHAIVAIPEQKAAVVVVVHGVVAIALTPAKTELGVDGDRHLAAAAIEGLTVEVVLEKPVGGNERIGRALGVFVFVRVDPLTGQHLASVALGDASVPDGVNLDLGGCQGARRGTHDCDCRDKTGEQQASHGVLLVAQTGEQTPVGPGSMNDC